LSRRELLRWLSAAGLIGASAQLAAQSMFARAARATPSGGRRRLLTIFLRGGNDGLNTLIPLHDSQYFAAGVRPTLKIAANQALDLGLGGAAFHPALARALEPFQAGELAAIARVGYANSSLSHFSSQRFFETAVPGDDSQDEGWVARWARFQAPGDALAAASVSAQVQRMYLGPQVVTHVPDLAQYTLSPDPVSAKILGSSSDGLGSAYAATPRVGYDALVRSTGRAMRESLLELSTLVPVVFAPDSFPADPSACAAEGLPNAWWAATFLANARDALELLLASECTIAGIELPGFDHHSSQGGVGGDHAARLSVVAHALRSLRREAQANGAWNDLAVLVVSEFGRTSRENGSGGTDHGRAGVALLAGGRVLGGVHHCDPLDWPAGATLFSDSGKYIAHLTDYRTLYAEVLRRHLQLADPDLDLVIPGFTQLIGPEFQELGLFA
jgi:uncharacterized protein (DUF1501 family)